MAGIYAQPEQRWIPFDEFAALNMEKNRSVGAPYHVGTTGKGKPKYFIPVTGEKNVCYYVAIGQEDDFGATTYIVGYPNRVAPKRFKHGGVEYMFHEEAAYAFHPGVRTTVEATQITYHLPTGNETHAIDTLATKSDPTKTYEAVCTSPNPPTTPPPALRSTTIVPKRITKK